MSVDDMTIATRETDERDATLVSNADCERRRRGDGREQTDACRSCFLNHLIARATAHDHVAGRGVFARTDERTNCLVERVVSPDILANEAYALPRNRPR